MRPSIKAKSNGSKSGGISRGRKDSRKIIEIEEDTTIRVITREIRTRKPIIIRLGRSTLSQLRARRSKVNQ
jgi:hypothetical protein